MYSKKVMEHFMHPKHAKKMEDPNGIGEVGNLACGDIMKVFIKVKKDNNGNEIIKDISFLTYGCGAAIASSDALCELAKGKTVEEAKKITNRDIVNFLGGEMPEIKLHCSILGMQALRKAIEDYESRLKK